MQSLCFYSETTKTVLIASSHVRLKCSGFVKFASRLTAVSPRILLSGPPGRILIPRQFYFIYVLSP